MAKSGCVVDKQVDLTVKSISVNEVNHMTKKTDSKLYKEIKKNLDSEMINLDERKTQLIGEIDDLDNRKDWIDWIGKYGDNIEKRFKNVSSELLEGVIDSIVVSPRMGKNRDNKPIQVGHILDVNFKLPIVNDSIKYVDPKNKTKGYTVVNGKKSLEIVQDISKGGRGKSVKKKVKS